MVWGRILLQHPTTTKIKNLDCPGLWPERLQTFAFGGPWLRPKGFEFFLHEVASQMDFSVLPVQRIRDAEPPQVPMPQEPPRLHPFCHHRLVTVGMADVTDRRMRWEPDPVYEQDANGTRAVTSWLEAWRCYGCEDDLSYSASQARRARG